MLGQDLEHRRRVLGVALVGAHASRGPRTRRVGVTGHEGRDGSRPRATRVGVVGETRRHQESTEVGVAQTELTELTRVLPDLLGRVVRRTDDDLLGGEDDLDGGGEGLDVEGAVVVEELHEVEAGEVAGRVVDVHVLRARVRPIDPRGVG